MSLTALYDTCFNYPAIDNHAHPLLKEQYRDKIPFERVISEAEGEALTQDAPHTLACFRATVQLGAVLEVEHPTWESVKAARATLNYSELCRSFMGKTRIKCLFLDDGLDATGIAEPWAWHNEFAVTKRLVRLETEAEKLLKALFQPFQATPADFDAQRTLNAFHSKFGTQLLSHATNNDVVGFKSIVCYRTGMDIATDPSFDEQKEALGVVFKKFVTGEAIRLAHKPLNDYIVNTGLRVGAKWGKPIQFHTGLGDTDITLTRSSPVHMQNLIKAHPLSVIILLHASYPYTREASYLAAMYSNVYLDFGEVFPVVSGSGQRGVIKQMLELCPTNKLLWSTDGHWFPESFYLGTLQARQALYDVFEEFVKAGDLTESQAVSIVKNVMFHNANKIYDLGLTLR